MMSESQMTTEEIKKGLESIKRAQLEVLRQLKADSLHQFKQSPSIRSLRYLDEAKTEMEGSWVSEGYQAKGNKEQFIDTKPGKQDKNPLANTPSINDSTGNNATAVTNTESIQKLKRQFSLQRESLNEKLSQITNKLNLLDKQTQKNRQVEITAEREINQMRSRVNELEVENDRYKRTVVERERKMEEVIKSQKKLRAELELKAKQVIILETEIKSLRGENAKLLRRVKQCETQLNGQSQMIRQRQLQQQQQKQVMNRGMSKSKTLDLDLVMNQIRAISENHEYLFERLKESVRTMEMSWVERESQIQTSFSRVLDYVEVMAQDGGDVGKGMMNTNDGHKLNTQATKNTYDMTNMNSAQISSKNSNNINKHDIFRDTIRQSQQSDDRSELQYIVKEMKRSSIMKGRQYLQEENEELRRRVRELRAELLRRGQGYVDDGREVTQGNRVIRMQLEEMRQQIERFKRFRVQVNDQQQELQKQIAKYKLRVKTAQTKLQTETQKLIQMTHQKYALQRKSQQQATQIVQLNGVVKDMGEKVVGKKEGAQSALIQLRGEFNKLLETNSLLLKQNQSLKTINEALQSQLSTLLFEKSQFEANIKQKHDMIEREIKQRTRLLQQLQQKDLKLKQLQNHISSVKSTIQNSQQQMIKQRQQLETEGQQRAKEVMELRKQVEGLYKQVREGQQVTVRYEKLQAEFKQLSRKSIRMGEALAHLWSVKEAEYANINNILGMLKPLQKLPNQQAIQKNYQEQQSSAHF